MAKRACLGPGNGKRCPNGAVTDRDRCRSCAQVKDRARGTRQERGYDADHDGLRASYQRRMNRGESFRCWRCGNEIDPEHWHLGHDDDDRSVYQGPECPPCNLATSGR